MNEILFNEIVEIVRTAARKNFLGAGYDNKTILECATRIYIAQMFNRENKDNET